jgi:hypothetical protein
MNANRFTSELAGMRHARQKAESPLLSTLYNPLSKAGKRLAEYPKHFLGISYSYGMQHRKKTLKRTSSKVRNIANKTFRIL